MSYSQQPNKDWGELPKFRCSGPSTWGPDTYVLCHLRDKRETIQRSFIYTSHLEVAEGSEVSVLQYEKITNEAPKYQSTVPSMFQDD
jgi:hypothetical protein